MVHAAGSSLIKLQSPGQHQVNMSTFSMMVYKNQIKMKGSKSFNENLHEILQENLTTICLTRHTVKKTEDLTNEHSYKFLLVLSNAVKG